MSGGGDARWIEIQSAVDSAVRHFGSAKTIYDTLRDGKADLDLYVIEMGFLHAMQSGHASVENALMHILNVFNEAPPSGPNWHADLIARIGRAVGSRPAVLSGDLLKAANETRQFRHVAVKAYDSFDWARAGGAVDQAGVIAAKLPEAIARLRMAIDP